VPREEARPASVDEKQYQKLLVSMMDESKVAAKVVGLRAAGYEVKITGQGAQVQEVAETSRATGILQAGDVIIGANGQPIATADDLIALLRTRRAGETLELQVKRGEETLTLPVPLGESRRTTRPGADRRRRADPPLRVSAAARGQSPDQGRRRAERGLMFSLGVYNAVTDDDITRGHKIAGTGTISTDGTVGAVGGVKYKVLAAEKAGAEVFLVPQDNTAEAQQAGAHAAHRSGTHLRRRPHRAARAEPGDLSPATCLRGAVA
jgi:PDZ domain-containing protein